MIFARLPNFKSVRSQIPDLYSASPIFSLGDTSFEVEIAQRMIRDLDRESLDTRLRRRTLRYSPALQYAIKFEPKVPVKTRCVMFLDDEPWSDRS